MTDTQQPTMRLLEELAVRCEIVSGRDRELDAQIRCALNGIEYPMEGTLHGRLMRQVRQDCAERYTGSIDAAISLVPLGWHVAAIGENREADDYGPYIGGWFARLHWNGGGLLHNLVYGSAATQPRAIVAAALRARHTLNLENARG